MIIPHICGIIFLINHFFNFLKLPIHSCIVAAICFAAEFILKSLILKKAETYYASCRKASGFLLVYSILSSAGLVLLLLQNEGTFSYVLGLVLIIYSFFAAFSETSALLGLLFKFATKASDAFFKLWQAAIYIYLLTIASYVLLLWKSIAFISKAALYLSASVLLLWPIAEYIILIYAAKHMTQVAKTDNCSQEN